KTGKSSISKDPEDIRQGLRFQLPLYALALQEEFDQYNVVYGGYYLVKDDQNCQRIPQFFDRDAFPVVSGNPKSALPGKKIIDDNGNPLTMAQLLEKSKRRAVQTTRSIKKGNFRHTHYPNDRFCTQYCVYRKMCQKNVHKLKYLAEHGQEE
ncbi:MAG: hypothetical protein GF313_09175, partial [Caldithrix sp.]|nr:hypothetical protein [Caldithrix sp.]